MPPRAPHLVFLATLVYCHLILVSSSAEESLSPEAKTSDFERLSIHSTIPKRHSVGPRRASSAESRNTKSNFSPWTDWTACSRTCGGGISTRSRICDRRNDSRRPVTCSGETKQFRVCNTRDCSKYESDFRQLQCSAHNNRKIGGAFSKEWFSVSDQNDCELKCRSRETDETVKFGKVSNGAKCFSSETETSVCVNGRCLPVGCDSKVGSKKILNECFVCGAKNGTCIMIRDVFHGQVWSKHQSHSYEIDGYKEVAFIPAGASRILVEDNSDNYLALMDSTLRFVINGRLSGHRSVGWPGPYKIAGTTVNYSRKGNDESFSITGPIQEGIYIMAYLVKKNPGIRYQYWIPKDNVKTGFDERYNENSINNRRPKHPGSNRDRSSFDPASNQVPRELDFLHPSRPSRYPETRNIDRGQNFRYGLDSMQSTSDWSYDTTTTPASVNYADNQTISEKTYLKKNTRQCNPCEKVKSMIKNFCKSEFVLRARVLAVQSLGIETRYALEIIKSYKNTIHLTGREYIWSNDKCRCPKLRRGFEYILMGKTDPYYRGNESRLFIDKQSFTRKYTLKRNQALDNFGKNQERKCLEHN